MKKIPSWLRLIALIAVLVSATQQLWSQTCTCNEYIYLNEITNGGKIHKYRINANGSLTEINPGGPWYPNGGASELASPHGLGRDQNGNLYVANTYVNNGQIRRLDCDGNLKPTSEFVINNAGTFNISSLDNTIFANTSASENVTAYSTCNGSIQNSVCFVDPSCASWQNGNCAGEDWGFYYDKRTGYFYTAYPQDQNDNNGNSNKKAAIYRYTIDDFGSGTCVPRFVESTSTTFGQLPAVGAHAIPLTNISGITTDDQGNIYYAATGYLEPGRIVKLDPNGNFLAASAIDPSDGNGGYWGARAIVWSETNGFLYVSTQTNTSTEDCISRFDTNLNYLGAAVNAVGSTGQGQTGFGSGKAMAIGMECCPNFASTSVNETVCVPATGTVVSLVDYLPCDDICAGDWVQISNTGASGGTAGVFNDCNNTFTYQRDGQACFRMTYTPSGPNAICSAFTIDLCLTFACYSIGNQVFEDTDNSGNRNGTEAGINGVQLRLLNADGSVYDSNSDVAGIQQLTVTTANGGYYRFDGLPQGDFVVEVLASNFNTGGPLEDLDSSTGAAQEANPNTNGDLNDNGLDAPVVGAIRSGVITLMAPEPTGETQPASYGAGSTTGTNAADANNNLTVDFGFFACIPPAVQPDFTVCSPATTTDLNDAAAGHNWSFVSGPATATVNAMTGAISGMSANGVYIFAYTRTADNCVAQVRVTRLQPNAGADQNLCAPTTTASLGTAPGGYAWSFVSGPATAAVNASTGAVTGMTANGAYTFRLTFTASGCTDDVVVTRLPAPTAGPDDAVCAPETTYTLAGPGPGEAWSLVSAPLFTTPVVTPTGSVTGITTAGAYRFRLSNGSCFDEVVITKAAAPAGGADLGVCEPATTADLPNMPAGSSWSFTSGPATATVNASTGAITGLTANGAYVFTATNAAGCTDQVTVTRSAVPSAGADVSLCGSAMSTVNLVDAGVGEMWTIQSKPFGSPAAVNATTGVVTGLTSAGNHVIRLTNAAGCFDEVNIGVGTQPNAGGDLTMCEPDNLLYFELPAPGAGNVYQFVSGPATPNLTYYWYATGFTANGVYTIRLVNTASGCFDEMTVTRLAGPDAGQPQNVCSTQTGTQLKTPSVNESWSWVSGGLPAATVNAATGEVTGMNFAGNYVFRLTNSVTGCATDVTVTKNSFATVNAGTDFGFCAGATTADLPFAPAAGQSWSFVTGPVTPTITQNAAEASVAGMTMDGAYTFRLTSTGGCTDTDDVIITRDSGPTAQGDVQICNSATTTTLTPAGIAFVQGWYAPPAGENPSNATIGVLNGVVSGMANDGIYQFYYRDVAGGSLGCQDTVFVTKGTTPSAGADFAICAPATTADLPNAPAGQSWSVAPGNPAAATVDPATGAVTGMTADGDYTFILDNLGCTDEVVISRVQAPTGGGDVVACLNEIINLPDAGANQSWAVNPSNPNPSAIDASTGVVTGASSAGFYSYILTNILTTCADTVQVQLQAIPNASPASLEVCEDTPSTGIGTFDLTTLEILISDDPISWFEDAALTMPIGTPAAFASSATTVYAQAANANCEAVAPVTLTVQALPVVASTPSVVCLGGDGTGQITVAASLSDPGTLEYSLDGAPYQAENEFLNVADGTYTIFVRVVGTTCTTTISNVQVACDCDDPTLETADPAAVCSPATVDITTASVITTNTGVTTTYWQDAAASIPLNGATGPATAIQQSGIYYIKSEALNPACFTVAPVQVIVHPAADFGGPYSMTLCDDGAATVDLTEQIIGYDGFMNVMWTDGVNPVATPTAVMPAGNTTYTLTADNANGCPGTATVNVVVAPVPTFTYLVSNCDANGMRTITVNANIAGGGALEYSFNLGAFDSGNTFMFEAVSTPQVSIDVRAAGGNCIANDFYNVVACAAPATFDLALTKRVAALPAGPYSPGDAVSFDVMVYNQGTVTAYDIDVADYFNPAELTFGTLTLPITTMGLNAVTVTQVGATPAYEINELASGDAVMVTLNFTINAGFAGTSIINNAEIVDASDSNGGVTATDQDSPLTIVNDGTTNELATDGDIDDEAAGTPGTADNAADEDDYDPAQVTVVQPGDFDLALTKVVAASPAGPYSPSDAVSFEVTVYNQGAITAYDIDVADYFDGTALNFVDITAPTMTTGSNAVTITQVPASPNFEVNELMAGDAVIVTLNFTIDAAFAGTSLVNNAEIVDASDSNGGATATDQDSPLTTVNDGTTNELATDGNINDEAPGTPGTMDNPADEDDYDPAQVTVQQTVTTYSLGSTVFEDLSNNGRQDTGEPGIADVRVQLFDNVGTEVEVGPDGILGTADDAPGGMLTSNTGNYHFQQLPAGVYQVRIPAAAFGAGEPLETINISSTPTNVMDNEEDGDDNGSQTGGGTIVTSPLIELGEPNGEPVAGETFQGGALDNGALDAFGDMTVDFGFFAPVSLGDTTWVDVNENGLQDPTEPRLQGVTVTLYKADGTPVTMDAEGNPYSNTTTTNAMGFYEFTNLPPASYYVVFDISTAPGSEFYVFTTNTGANPTDNSDADPGNGQSSTTGAIASGGRFPDLDAGVICNVTAEAGIGQTICATATIDLTALGASISPTGVAGFGATWTSGGTGTFNGGGVFGTATTYTPSAADIAAGQVVLTLTTDNPMNPPFNNPVCGPASDDVLIIILKVNCGTFPWDGN